MKRHALILSAGLALLTASVADAQESGHLSEDYLKQATPLIHWPQGLEPRNVDVFVHNEGWIDAPPEIILSLKFTTPGYSCPSAAGRV